MRFEFFYSKVTGENNDGKLCSTADYKGFRFADGWARVSGVESRGEKGGRAGAVSRVVARRVGAREWCRAACLSRVFVYLSARLRGTTVCATVCATVCSTVYIAVPAVRNGCLCDCLHKY